MGDSEPEVVVGKPNPLMLTVLSRSAHLDLDRSIMVGDRLDTDIAFGNGAKLRTVLVLTGVTSREQVGAVVATCCAVAFHPTRR